MAPQICNEWMFYNTCSNNKCKYKHPKFTLVGFEFINPTDQEEYNPVTFCGSEFLNETEKVEYKQTESEQEEHIDSSIKVVNSCKTTAADFQFGPFEFFWKSKFDIKVSVMPTF